MLAALNSLGDEDEDDIVEFVKADYKISNSGSSANQSQLRISARNH